MSLLHAPEGMDDLFESELATWRHVEHVARGRRAVVDDEVAVDVRHHRATDAAVFRAERVRLNLEFLNRVRRRAHHEARVERVVVGRAVEQEVVRLIAHAVDVEATGRVTEAARRRVAV